MPAETPSGLRITLANRAIPPIGETIAYLPQSASLGKALYEWAALPQPLPDITHLELDVPEVLLNQRWELLHDGYQYSALRVPIALTLADAMRSAPPPLKHRPLRILMTDGRGAGGAQDDRVLERLRTYLNSRVTDGQPAVELTILHEAGALDIFLAMQGAQDNHAPFHIWHHVGECVLTSAGLQLPLFNGELSPHQIHRVFEVLQPFSDDGCRMVLIHTPSDDTPMLPILATLPVPCAVGLTMSSASMTLLRGLIARLLTCDVATAVHLARLDHYIEPPHDISWSALHLLCRTEPFHLVDQSWNRPAQFDSTNPIPRMLFLRANPLDAQQGMIPIDREIKAIRTQLERRPNSVYMIDRGALERHELSGYLLKIRPHLLHFSAHGSDRASLLLEDNDGNKTFVRTDQIAPLIVAIDSIRCVVLNACFSAALADRLEQSGMVVIGMSASVSDDAAKAFAFGFYQALALGESVACAFELGRLQIGMSGATDEVDIPQLRNSERAAQLTFFQREHFKGAFS
jgi:hypothetical protein